MVLPQRIAIGNIKVHWKTRQRQKDRDPNTGLLDVETDGLLDSIKSKGVITPILLDKENNLIYGERRYTAAKIAGLTEIPFFYVENLTPLQSETYELIENVRRHDLHWIDETIAVKRFHSLNVKSDPKWTQEDTARELGYNITVLKIFLRVGEDIQNDEKLRKCVSVREAYNLLSRRDDRARQDLVNDIVNAGSELFDEKEMISTPDNLMLDGNEVLGEPENVAPLQTPSSPKTGGGDAKAGSVSSPVAKSPPKVIRLLKSWEYPAQEHILNVSFLDWIKSYKGPRFNFIHCDFPYGKGVFNGPQSGRARHEETYDDSENVYWDLIDCLCENIDKIMSPNAHLMFWLENDCLTQARTLARFREKTPDLIFNSTPLVWFKTDNVGVLSDPKRGPRNVYETALIASRGDRFIVKATSNCYGCPTDKQYHPSTKPEPMLKTFFQMFVDENSMIFDPTCGGGSALRAAESLGAKSVLGLERSQEHHKSAVAALQTARNKRRAEG